jgi:hypothetical protein
MQVTPYDTNLLSFPSGPSEDIVHISNRFGLYLNQVASSRKLTTVLLYLGERTDVRVISQAQPSPQPGLCYPVGFLGQITLQVTL